MMDRQCFFQCFDRNIVLFRIRIEAERALLGISHGSHLEIPVHHQILCSG